MIIRLFKRSVAAAAALTLLFSAELPKISAAGNVENIRISTSSESTGSQIFSDFEEAAVYMRPLLKNRTKNISVALPMSLYNGDLNDFMCQLFACVLAETGAPDEGDYLRYGIHAYNCTVSFNARNITCNMSFEYFTTAEQEREVDQKIGQIMTSLDLNGLTDYEKMCRIYEYVINCAEYEYDPVYYPERHSAYGALFNGKSVCQGFSQLFYRLCMTAGIPCRIISSENHAWNIAKIYGNYYLLDPTWDEYLTSIDRCKFFLKGTEDFDEYTTSVGVTGESHQPTNKESALIPGYLSDEFQKRYPISATAYEPANAVLPTYLLGDVDNDGIVTGSDATLVLMAYTQLSSGKDHGFNDTQFSAADVDKDGIITGSDATMILSYYTYISSGKTLPMEDYLADLPTLR